MFFFIVLGHGRQGQSRVHRVASVTCGPGPCTGCPQNGQSRFGTSCTTALQFSSQDHLA